MEDNGKRKILVVDFDGTIIRHDSFFMFLRHLAIVNGRKNWLTFSVAFTIIGYALHILSAETAKRKILSVATRGMTASVFDSAVCSFTPKIEDDLRTDIYKRVVAMREEGFEAVIVSASADKWICPWAELHRDLFVDVIATKIETVVSEGRITRLLFITPNCNGGEKVRRVEDWLAKCCEGEYSRDNFFIVAIGNSKGDKELSGFADKAYFVG